MQRDSVILNVLDWQIRNILRLKNESRTASGKEAERIRSRINSLYGNLEQLDPDHTQRLKLISVYMKKYARSFEGKKRLSLLTFSLSGLLHFCNPQSNDVEFFTKKLLENRQIARIIQNGVVRE